MKLKDILFMKKSALARKKGRRREQGQALVEFAVSLVLLMIILSGILDLGRLFFHYIAMRDAAQEGVVYGIIEPDDCAEIVARTEALLSDDTRTSVAITVNGTACNLATAADACSGSTLLVEVIDSGFPITMPFLATFLGRDTLELNASVTGTVLRPQCP